MSSSPLHIIVRLFASLREAAGVEEIALELPAGAPLREVWPRLVERYPALNGYGTSLAWAVNHTYAKLDEPLHDGDQVAVLPPVSGG